MKPRPFKLDDYRISPMPFPMAELDGAFIQFRIPYGDGDGLGWWEGGGDIGITDSFFFVHCRDGETKRPRLRVYPQIIRFLAREGDGYKLLVPLGAAIEIPAEPLLSSD